MKQWRTKFYTYLREHDNTEKRFYIWVMGNGKKAKIFIKDTPLLTVNIDDNDPETMGKIALQLAFFNR